MALTNSKSQASEKLKSQANCSNMTTIIQTLHAEPNSTQKNNNIKKLSLAHITKVKSNSQEQQQQQQQKQHMDTILSDHNSLKKRKLWETSEPGVDSVKHHKSAAINMNLKNQVLKDER